MSLRQRIVDRAPASLANLKRATERFGAQMRASANGPEALVLVGSAAAEKAFLARAIHDTSRRKDQPFIRVACREWSARALGKRGWQDCATEDMVAIPLRPRFSTSGLLRSTNAGTLFLEHVDELPAPTQEELFPVLSRQQVELASTGQSTPVDIFTIASVDAYFADRDADECALVRVPINLLASYLSYLDLVWTIDATERAADADQRLMSLGRLSLGGIWSAGVRLIHNMQPSELRAWLRAWAATHRHF